MPIVDVAVPVGCPFPDVSSHIHYAVVAFAFRETADRCEAVLITIVVCRCVRVGFKGIAPGPCSIGIATRCFLPFRLCRESHTFPRGVSVGIVPRYTDHWVVRKPFCACGPIADLRKMREVLWGVLGGVSRRSHL